MEPFDTIDRLRDNDSFDDADVESLRELTTRFPDVPELWDCLGDVIQLANDGDDPLLGGLACYQRAIACDPTYATAHESLGFYYDLFDEFQDAERHFRLAISHGAGDTSLIGLARILEQQGQHDDAQSTMDDCADQSHPRLIELRNEIAEGQWAPDVET